MHLKLDLCYISVWKIQMGSAEVQTSHPGILNVSTSHVPLSSTTILYVHVHHSLFMGTELLSAPVLISSCQTDLYLINTEWHWPASAWQASMDIPVNWDHFGPSFISNWCHLSFSDASGWQIFCWMFLLRWSVISILMLTVYTFLQFLVPSATPVLTYLQRSITSLGI